MRQAAALIAQFTAGLDFDGYAADAMVRAAVEREFEIIGEALSQLAKLAPEIANAPWAVPPISEKNRGSSKSKRRSWSRRSCHAFTALDE